MARLLSGPDPVAETLARWASEPFEWGVSDCASSVLDHVERVTGKVLDWRPRPASQEEANALLRAEGGLVALCDRAAFDFGLTVAEMPERGDVGVVMLPRVGLTACLCAGPFWAAKGHYQAVMNPIGAVALAKAWRLPCPMP